MPEVTVLMTTYNSERTLPAALGSVRAQTFADWELLLMDGGSSDRTVHIAAEADPRVRIVSGGSGLSRAARLNHLLDVARTPLVAVMDADDVCYPNRLERQVEFMRAHAEIDLVGAPLLVFGVDGRAVGKRAAPTEHEEICACPWAGFRLFQPTWVGRTEWFRRHRYSERAVRCEDQDLLYRSYRTSVFANVSEPLLGYREESLAMRKLLPGRWHWIKLTGASLWRDGSRGDAMRLAASQVAKASADALALGTGLGARLAVVRSGPMSDAEVAEWDRIWTSIGGAQQA
jgi:glycosyltransferase involved in cell wall biosynthesis